ncbi:hypothetical protein EVAR_57084_1 [Eumeta japonica]|uniref:Uncharacterized protein n=1 Tax=Eumeta variegata TaxID=151549 RepID=A0A4C1Z9B3_EUMVA|nr:hypothetical protein EVAR_57084_1 [Eumeta japonica]
MARLRAAAAAAPANAGPNERPPRRRGCREAPLCWRGRGPLTASAKLTDPQRGRRTKLSGCLGNTWSRQGHPSCRGRKPRLILLNVDGLICANNGGVRDTRLFVRLVKMIQCNGS